MSISTILAILNVVETAHSVLETSGLLARRLEGARIDVLHIRAAVDPGFMPTEEVMSESREREFQAKENQRSSDLEDIWSAWQRETEQNTTAVWRVIAGETKSTIAAEGSKVDLVVIGHAAHSHDASADAIQAALFSAKAPVVLVPETVPHVVGRHIAVAWKPNEAADRAIQAALPILFAAERVTVLIATEDGIGDATPQALTASLALRPRELEIHRFNPAHGGVGYALMREASLVGADLLVMGAYSHNRLVESLLGGATRDVLAETALPTLMHH